MLIELYSDLVHARRRNKIIDINDVDKYISTDTDWYRSLFVYNQEIVEHVNKIGSVAGFKGAVFIDFLVWDCDSNNIEESLIDAKILIKRLIKEYDLQPNEIRVAFSGNKGFSIEVSTKGLNFLDVYDINIPNLVRNICCKIAEDLKTVDKNIYQHNRLFRIAGTLHQKSKLFKNHIPLSFLNNNIDDIKNYCKSDKPKIDIKDISSPEKLNNLIAEVKNKKTTINIPEVIEIDSLSIPKCSPKEKYCIHMLKQGIETGERHNALMRIAVYERQKGYGPRSVKGTLEDALEKMKLHNLEKAEKDPFDLNMLQRIASDAFKKIDVDGQEIYQFSYGCNDCLLVKYCSADCYLQKSKKVSKSRIYQIDGMSKEYVNFMNNYEHNIINSGLKTLENQDVKFFRGTMNLIVGRSGSGKSSSMLNILRHSNKQAIPSVFFSLDMYRDMIFQKMITFCSPYSLTEIQKIYKDKNIKQIEEIKEKYLYPAFKYTYFNFDTKISLAEVSDYVKLIEEETKKKVGFVVIDYASKLYSDYKTEYEKESHNAQWAADIAKDLDVCLLIVAQTSRSIGGDGITPMGNASAKGSGMWESEATLQLNVFRPFRIAADFEDCVIGFEIAKNRFGKEGVHYLHWNGAKSAVRDFTAEEQQYFLELKEFMPKRKRYQYGSDSE